ncbi:MAG: Trk system potassium transporter TrkA [Bacteroidetes bacterium HGW-Bacteroidetes-21]|jgi:trk system potassium uptake protein TrkA|nr:MAG: Trk system potassium transporter TrkA [Bacteroidetes bacterium HGW-Bacteroidetes-21]
MNIVIAGAGEVGYHLAQMLSKENHTISIIDKNKERLDQISNQIDVLAINGETSTLSSLKAAGCKGADLFIALTQSEDTNLLSCLIAKKVGAEKCIARIDNSEFLDDKNISFFKEMGIDLIICPEKQAAGEIVGLLKQTGTSEIMDFSGGKLSLYVVKLEENAPVVGKTLAEVAKMQNSFHFTAIAINRNQKTIIPKGNDILQPNDLVFVITDTEGIPFILSYSGKERFDINDIMIVGASRIAKKTARHLEKHLNIKIIEKDKSKCEEVAAQLNTTLIINGDGTNVDLLIDEGIKRMDAFLALTGNSETNILSCLLAKSMGVKKVIAEIENIDFIDIADRIGIDTIINKKFISASYIYRYTMKAEVSSIKCLTGADAELMELVAKPGSKITTGSLREINFPADALIGGVIRGNNGIIANGKLKIEPYDRVIVFVLPSSINIVQDFFN